MLRPGVGRLESRRLLAASGSDFPIRVTGGPSESIALGPDKNIWFTLGTDNVGMINLKTNAITQYPIPSPNAAPSAIVAASDGNL